MKTINTVKFKSTITIPGCVLDSAVNDKPILSGRDFGESYHVFVKTSGNGDKTIVVKNGEYAVSHEEKINFSAVTPATMAQRLNLLLARAEVLYGAVSSEVIPQKEQHVYQLAIELRHTLQQIFNSDAQQNLLFERWCTLLKACVDAEIITQSDCQRLAQETKITVQITNNEQLIITQARNFLQKEYTFNATFLPNLSCQISDAAMADIIYKGEQLHQTLVSTIGTPLHNPTLVSDNKTVGKQFYYGVTEMVSENRSCSHNHGCIELRLDTLGNMQVKAWTVADLFWDRCPTLAAQALGKLTAIGYARALQTELRQQLPATLLMPFCQDMTDSHREFQKYVIAAFQQLGLTVEIAPPAPSASISEGLATVSKLDVANDIKMDKHNSRCVIS